MRKIIIIAQSNFGIEKFMEEETMKLWRW